MWPQDRFTKDLVVVSAQTKPKTGGYELQLPSMGSLTSKTSSQAFFLRILKVILQLRDAARLAAAKAKRKQTETPIDSSGTLVASTSSTATSGDVAAPNSAESAAAAGVLPPPPPTPTPTLLPIATVPLETNTAEVPAPMEVNLFLNFNLLSIISISQNFTLFFFLEWYFSWLAFKRISINQRLFSQ